MLKRLKQISLSTKFRLLSLLILICLLGPNLILYNYIYSKEYEKQIMETSKSTLEAMNTILDSIVYDVSTFSAAVQTNQPLQNLIKSNNFYYNPNNDIRIQSTLYNLSLSTQNISSIYLLDSKDHIYSYYSSSHRSSPLLPNDFINQWENSARLKKGGASVFLSNELTENDTSFISVFRQINDLDYFTEIGFVSVQIGSDILTKAFQPIINNTHSKLIILQPDNVEFMRLSSDRDNDLSAHDFDFSPGESAIFRHDGNQYVVSVTYNDLTKLIMMYISPADQLSDNLVGLRITSTLIAILGAVILVFGTLLIFQRLMNPLKELVSSMNSVIDNADFKPVIVKTRHDEIDVLKNVYNIMIGKIQSLIRKSIDEEKQKRKAELSALQAQIKPHFLYNTLDSIRSLALNGDNNAVSDITFSLSNFYKLSLSSGNTLISIEKEIEILKSYASILSVRYPGVFSIEYEIAGETLHYQIPKLTLQPFVENAVYHGIRPMGEGGVIKIRSWLSDTQLLIQVEDNGVGMSNETLDQLISGKNDSRQQHFGVRSTINRIKLMYGQDVEVRIESEKDVGTTVTMAIPLEAMKNETTT